MGEKYILFKRTRIIPRTIPPDFFGSLYLVNDGEGWKQPQPSNSSSQATEPTEILEFVAEVSSPNLVAVFVRKAPLEKYVLFKGEVTDIQVAIPVFVNGKSLDSMDEEWKESQQ